MHTYRHYSEMSPVARVAALGNFDGIHNGHHELLRRVVKVAGEQSLVPSVLTFDPHPVHVLAPAAGLRLISSVETRLRELHRAGIQDILLQRFNAEFASLSASAFVKDVLVDAMGLRHVVVGYDFGFGHKRSGSVETLRTMGPALGFSVEVVGEQTTQDGKPVSSTRIRKALADGDVEEANLCLGRRVSFSGVVIEGEQRGRQLGFPTANLQTDHDPLLADGVYAVLFDWGIGQRAGVVNIGSNPTFGNSTQRSIEVHVLDEKGLDLYGRHCRAWVVTRLRGEHAFDSVDGLKNQIAIDCERARKALNESS